MNIRQVRQKIKSVSNVKKITKAMQLMSAIKMKKAQQIAKEGKPYIVTLEEILKKIISQVNPKLSDLLKSNEAQRELIIIITSNKGLCGSFHFNLFRFCLKNVDFKQADFVTIGKKGTLFASRMGGRILADFSESQPISTVSAVFEMVLKKFNADEYKQVTLVYNNFISTIKIEPVKEVILPVKYSFEENKKIKIKEEYLIEPSPNEIVDSLLKNFVEEKIRGAVINSEAGEHSARMMAMKNATDNATEITYELTLLRNKLRQEKITYELLDMITAKESVGES